MIEQKQDDIVKVDLEKGSSDKFEVRTMEEDLKKVQAPPPPPAEEQKTSLPPPQTPLPEPPEFLLEEEKKGSGVKSFIIGFAVVLIVGFLGVGAWWYASNRPLTEQTPPEEEIPPSQLVIADAPLLPVDKSITLELGTQETKESVLARIASLIETSRQGFSQGSIVRIALTEQDGLLPLDEFARLLGIELPSSLVRERFTLLFYIQEPEPVFGLVGEAADGEALSAYLASQEQEIPALASTLYADYTKSSLAQAASQTFLENTYQGVSIRYINFDTPSRSVDYAFYNDLFLLAGSREAMFTMIDRAKLKQVIDESGAAVVVEEEAAAVAGY